MPAVQRKETDNDLDVDIQIEPLLLNRHAAAALLSVSPRKLGESVVGGLIAKRNVDGVMRITVEELRRFVREQSDVRASQKTRTADEGCRPQTQTPLSRNGVDSKSS
jgi:hypothetical protein